MRVVRRIALIALAVAVAGALVAPAATAATRSLESRIRKSAVATESEGSVRFTGSFTIDAGPDASGAFGMDGVMDLDRQEALINLDFGDLLGTPVVVEERLVDGVVYLNMGDLFDALGETPPELNGRSWVSLTPDQLTGGQDLDPTSGNNPASQLDALRGIDDVVRVGRDEVGGTPTTHFEGTIDLEAAAERLPPEEQERLAQVLGSYGAGPIPVEVWLDDQNRVRKMSMTFEFEVPGEGAAQVGFEMELADFGTEVDVEAPPANEVIDYEEFQDLTETSSAV